jgi:hypothetical protein
LAPGSQPPGAVTDDEDAVMADDRDSAQALERRVKADAEARLKRARAEGRRVVEGEVAPQGVVAKDRSGPILVTTTREHRKGRRRSEDVDRPGIRAALAEGTMTITAIAKKFGCSEKTVRNVRAESEE